jgi:small nuclear ribonucleoprotein G
MSVAVPPSADFKKFLDKQLLISINAKRKIIGTVRGYDNFMNLTLENCSEVRSDTEHIPMGTVVLRGSSIESWECLDKVNI